jgi:hypothetical protein
MTVTDIPLVPSLVTGDPEREPNFILHWLNNKEMHFSLQAENILQVNLKIHWSLHIKQEGYFSNLILHSLSVLRCRSKPTWHAVHLNKIYLHIEVFHLQELTRKVVEKEEAGESNRENLEIHDSEHDDHSPRM